jgi:aldehyde:ferredoxin oxidoreductase
VHKKKRLSSLAWIDLSTGRTHVESADPNLSIRFLGGRGIGAALLSDHVADTEKPLVPENPLIFTAGPFTGTPWPTGARTHVTFHSPLTGIYGYANAGGFFGAALRRAGYDGLVITGRADHPVFLDVTPETLTVRSAEHLWGRGVTATHDALAERGARVACIGPAGENEVRVASIIADGSRAMARCGGGAVMGSKHLKAIVVRGKTDLHLPDDFKNEARRAFRRVRDHPHVEGLRDWGTVVLVAGKNATGDLPAYNHQDGQVPWAKDVSGAAVSKYTEKNTGCFACPIRCARVTCVESGPYAGHLEGPEYESLDALGPMCGIGDLEVIMHANRLCNDFGMDTISTGTIIAFAMECSQRGLLDDPHHALEWGDADSLLGLIEDIATRRGLGDLLAEGSRRAAAEIGDSASPYAMHVKGMELPRQEPRIAKGFGLGHATANRGADHLYALPTIDLAGNLEAAERLFPAAIVPELMNTDDETYKPDLVAFSENYCAVSDALGICKFSTTETYALYPEDLARGLGALWGREISGDDLLKAGERIVNLERLYNVKMGLDRAADQLPERFTSEPLPIHTFRRNPETEEMESSTDPVHVGQLDDFQGMLDRYYLLRGWDSRGVPTAEKLQELGLQREDT